MEESAFFVLIKTSPNNVSDLGRRYLIPPGGVFVGNVLEADIYFNEYNDGQPFKFQLVFRHGCWHVKNENPIDMVLVGKIPVHRCVLSDGDIIQVGALGLEFCLGNGQRAEFFEKNEEALLEDVLTKSLNRRAFLQSLERDLRRYNLWEAERRTNLSRSQHPPMSLVMLDVDHFGQFNKKYDSLVGDEVLKGVVARIKERVRATDSVGRYGGEEFLVYLPDTALEQARELAEDIRKIVADSLFEVGMQKHLAVTISLGVAQFEPHMGMDDFIRAANEKMNYAKNHGRNRVEG